MTNTNKKQFNLNSIDFVQDVTSETAALYSGGLAFVYKDSNLRGPRKAVAAPGTKNIGFSSGQRNGFNDEISSIEIESGRWRFYEHANFQGRSFIVGPGKYNLRPSFNDEISSLRPI